MPKRTLIIVIGAVLLFSTPAFAVDGQILINQSTVMAAGGFPYKITQPGSYKLSGNLVVGLGIADGIDIESNNVVLDLNGFAITGSPFINGSVSVSGISSANNSVTIRNGSVAGFNNGVSLLSKGGLVEEVHASNNSSTGILILFAIVRRCTATGNGVGISANGFLGGAVVVDNLASSNTGAGIYAYNSTVKDNVSTLNGEGIEAFLSTVIGNTTNANAYGLIVTECLYGSNTSIDNSTSNITAVLGSECQNNNYLGFGVVC
jgi:hypothetical protein